MKKSLISFDWKIVGDTIMKLGLIYEQMKVKELDAVLSEIIKTTVPKLYDNYRKVKPSIDKNDYYISTEAMFTNTKMTIDDFYDIPAPMFSSDSNSKYKIVGDTLYRMSDHWGRVASCNWDIDDYDSEGLIVGKVKFSDMSPNYDRSGGYIKYYPDAGKVLKAAFKKMDALRDEVVGTQRTKVFNYYYNILLKFKKNYENQ